MTDSLKMTFEEFRASMKLVTKQDASSAIGVEVSDIGGPCVRLYQGNMFIEDWGSDYEALTGKRFWTVIERSDWFEPAAKLETMEKRLYEWLCDDGSIYDPVKAAEKKESRAELYLAMRHVGNALWDVSRLLGADDDLNNEFSTIQFDDGKHKLVTMSCDEMAGEWLSAMEQFDKKGGEA